MPASTAASLSSTPTLAELLASATCLDEATVAEARRRRPGEVIAALEALVDEGLADPHWSQPAVRAVHLAAELGLEAAVPALVRCLDHLTPGSTLREAALTALARLGPAAVLPLAAAHAADRGADQEAGDRGEIAEVIAAVPADDPRIRAVLLRHAAEAPAQAARLLARRGDWRAVPGLLAAIDGHLARPSEDCLLCTSTGLEALTAAVGALGGTLSGEQVMRIDAVVDRADAELTPWDEEAEVAAPRAPVVRPPRLGRNAPCFCGSGKKYKKCHLAEDEAAARH